MEVSLVAHRNLRITSCVVTNLHRLWPQTAVPAASPSYA